MAYPSLSRKTTPLPKEVTPTPAICSGATAAFSTASFIHTDIRFHNSVTSNSSKPSPLLLKCILGVAAVAIIFPYKSKITTLLDVFPASIPIKYFSMCNPPKIPYILSFSCGTCKPYFFFYYLLYRFKWFSVCIAHPDCHRSCFFKFFFHCTKISRHHF